VVISERLVKIIRVMIRARVGDRRAELERLVQNVGLATAAKVARRVLDRPDAPYGEFAAWQQGVLGAALDRICNYQDLDDLPTPSRAQALPATLAFVSQMPPLTRQRLGDLLCLFELGPMLLGPARRPFTKLSPEDQDRYIERWECAPAAPMRAGFQGIKSACMMGYWTRPQAWPAIHYTLDMHPITGSPAPEEAAP
jgi:hypothetical protein